MRCPGPLAPISSTRNRVDSSARSTVSGSPISLLNERTGAIVGPTLPHSCASRSLVVVLPTEPVMPTTRRLAAARLERRLAQPLEHDAREVAERLLDVGDDDARQHGAAGADDVARGEHERGPAGDRHGGVVVAVDVLAGQRDEQAAGDVVARVDDDGSADDEGRVGRRRTAQHATGRGRDLGRRQGDHACCS